MLDLGSISEDFAITPGASVAVVCSPNGNRLLLHTATGPPVVGEGASFVMDGCDVMTFASTSVPRDPRILATELFGNEPNSVVALYRGTLLSNCNVRACNPDWD